MSQGYSGPPQSSGGGGGTVVVIILAVAAVLGLGCLGVCGLGFFGIAFTAQQAGQQLQQAAGSAVTPIEAESNEAVLVDMATAAIVNDVRVKQALGEPISVEGTFDRPHEVSGIDHLFDLPVTGPKGTATAHIEGRRAVPGWEITALKVTLSDGDTFDIDPKEPFSVPLDGGGAPVLPPEITDPPQSPDPLPDEPTP